jgi:transcription antitermination factor NusG
MPTVQPLHWFALQVKPNHECSVACALTAKGQELYLPLYRKKRRWSDRMKESEFPLFPGYVFCRFAPASRVPILTTPGVIRIVGFGGRAVPVDPEELAAVRSLAASGLTPEPVPYPAAGARVLLASGPLKGAAGKLLEINSKKKFVVSITLLRRFLAVEADPDWVILDPAAPESRPVRLICADRKPASDRSRSL